MFTKGAPTYRCSVDLEPYTLVRIKPASSGLVPNIEPAAYTVPVIGLTKRGGAAGEYVAVEPLNMDGFTRVRYTAFNGVSVGEPLYITGTGTVTDVETTGIEAGRALENIDDLSTTTIMLDITGAGGFNRASDLNIVDAGDYYSSPDKNIESCLDEVGSTFSVSHRILYTGAFLRWGVIDIPSAKLGGRLASDTGTSIYMGKYDTGWDGVLSATDTNALASTPVNQQIATPSLSIVDGDNPIDISIIYNWNVAYDQAVDVAGIRTEFPDTSSINMLDYTAYGTLGDVCEEFAITSTDSRFNTQPLFTINFKYNIPLIHTATEVKTLGIVTYYSKALPI